MGSELSMRARAEITKKYLTAYVKAPKRVKSQILDEVRGSTPHARKVLLMCYFGDHGCDHAAPTPQ
jgi:hypothetical protein